MANTFRYTEKVVFNVGLSVLLLVERSIIEQARIHSENKVRIFYLWEMLIRTCLYHGPGMNSDLPWAGNWCPGCLKPSKCSRNALVAGGAGGVQPAFHWARCSCAHSVSDPSAEAHSPLRSSSLVWSEVHWFRFYDKLVLYNMLCYLNTNNIHSCFKFLLS